MRARRTAFLMPRANSARGKVRGALPRTPARGFHPLKPLARGIPPETPAPFPLPSMFQNGPRRQGCAPENLFNRGKDFPPPRIRRAPLTAPGRSEDLPDIRERGQMQSQNLSRFAAGCGLPLVGPEPLMNFGVDKPS
jgi:hypothetical protein